MDWMGIPRTGLHVFGVFLAGAALGGLLLARPALAALNSAADFTISPTVVAARPPHFGFNIASSARGGNITSNAWITDGGFGPLDIRHDFTATADGRADGSTFVCTGSPGTDFYASISSGLFVSAQARVYRYNSTAHTWSLLRTGTVKDFTADASKPSDAPSHTITFSTGGPQIKAGDALWLSKDAESTSPDLNKVINFLDPRFGSFSPTWNPDGTRGYGRGVTSSCVYVHDTDVPPRLANGGSATPALSLKITDTASETGGIFQYLQSSSVGPDDEQFEPGHTYKFAVWLKQQSIGDGSATVRLDNLHISHTFTGVTGQWQHFTWQFPAPAGLSAGSAVPVVHLDYNAPGTLWAAQFELFDASHAPFSIDPRVLQMWKDFQPGTIRFWSNIGNSSSNYSYWSLDTWLSDESIGRGDIGIGNLYEKVLDQQHLPVALALAKQIGTNPWLIVNVSLSEQEWSNLVDYLCAPAGVGYAARRPARHPGPYTDDFSTIYLEVGNEQWGTITTATTNPGTDRYGAYAHYMVSQAIARKAYYNKRKLQFVANGFTMVPSLTSAVAQLFPEVSLVSYFSYSGGNNNGDNFDLYYQSELLSVPQGIGTHLAQIPAQQNSDAAAGHPYRLSVYEGGPGNDAPGSTTNGDTSLAAGTAAVDVALFNALHGFGPQNFFLYGLGTGPYSSHSNFAHGLRPHPVWEAFQMRNTDCAGDMVSVTAKAVPTTSDGKASPLVAAYAFHNATGYDIAVVSRDLNNATPVTLRLPQRVSSSATLYTLTGDPRASNDAALNIPIVRRALTHFSRTYTFTMPPGSFYIFRARTLGSAPTAVSPKLSPLDGSSASAQTVTLTRNTHGVPALACSTAGTNFASLTLGASGTPAFPVISGVKLSDVRALQNVTAAISLRECCNDTVSHV